ncbi:MAG TPA: hypothetical protein VGI12_01775 [Vicinamibacterales bacterium]
MAQPASSETQLHDAVARADRARRVRDTSVSLWKTAPLVAAACLAIAMAGRLRSWTPLVTLLVLVAMPVALAAYVAVARRHRVVSDSDVSRIDDEVGLHGELRSAHWFALAPERDDWIRFHLARAAERVGTVDWAGLYPPPAAGRAKLATGVLAAAVALVVLIPGRAGLAASADRKSPAAAARTPRAIIALPPDLRKKLENMLGLVESGRGRDLTDADVRDILDHLDDLARQDPRKLAGAKAANAQETPATAADLKAYAQRAKKAAESTSLEPQVRDMLADLADKLNDSEQNANAMSSRDAQDAAVQPDQGNGQPQQAKSGSGNQDGASVQQVKEAAGGSAAGVTMMTNQDASNARDGGLGLGGGAQDRRGGGHLVDLGAALKKETIEASADLQGDNIPTEERRKTEHADATVAFTHADAPPAERGSSTAPPPVPESRRAAVKSYFIRKQ